jgi:hypothetical protein
VLAWAELELTAVDELGGLACSAARMLSCVLCCHRSLQLPCCCHTLSSHLLLLLQKLWERLAALDMCLAYRRDVRLQASFEGHMRGFERGLGPCPGLTRARRSILTLVILVCCDTYCYNYKLSCIHHVSQGTTEARSHTKVPDASLSAAGQHAGTGKPHPGWAQA